MKLQENKPKACGGGRASQSKAYGYALIVTSGCKVAYHSASAAESNDTVSSSSHSVYVW